MAMLKHSKYLSLDCSYRRRKAAFGSRFKTTSAAFKTAGTKVKKLVPDMTKWLVPVAVGAILAAVAVSSQSNKNKENELDSLIAKYGE